MRNITTITLLINLFLSSQTISAQLYPSLEISRERKADIKIEFETQWTYFRMLKNPLIHDNEKYVDNSRANPYTLLLPKKVLEESYRMDIKISNWGEAKGFFPDKFGQNEYIDLSHNGFYLIEKGNGFFGIKKKFFSEEAPDSIYHNVYDSIFPCDNRFLAKYLYTNKNSFTEYFSFHSGNAEWGEWRDVGFIRRVDYCGYIRGVQFGIENVVKFRQEFSDKIRSFRPDFPNYVYTESRYTSLLTNGFLIIGAPEGKEDQLIEYIYYSNLPEKTGDPDVTHYYEMRYILPTQIESIKERRLEERRLTDEEQKYILDRSNEMLLFLDNKEDFFVRVRKAATAIIEDVEEIEE